MLNLKKRRSVFKDLMAANCKRAGRCDIIIMNMNFGLEEKLNKDEVIAAQPDREEVREKIRQLLEAEYERIQAAADEIAPDFDYEKEAESLRAEETDAEVAEDHEENRQHFEWKEDIERRKAEEEEAARRAEEEEARARRLKAIADTPIPPAMVSPSKYPKGRHYEPKTRLGRFALKDRHHMVLAASIVMMIAAMGYQMYDYLVPKNVMVSLKTYSGTQQAEYSTTSRTVGALFAELAEKGENSSIADKGIVIGSNDIASVPDEIPIRNGLELEIRHATKASASIAGDKREVWLVPGTVKENLDLNGISYDEDDEIRPDPGKQVSKKTKLVVDEVHYSVSEKNEDVEAESRVILDPSLTSGVQETTEGNDGEGVFTYTTKYINGKKQDTERELKEWITEPHDHVLRLGTSATGNTGEYRLARTFVANTTAYTAGPGARGALGMAVHVGTCAVDPRFVSLRSELWVEGYGYAYAMDTGGAVKGNVVDLYMSSNSQCIRWGRRNMTAYVLQAVD